MSFEQEQTPPSPIRKLRTGIERIKSKASLENTQSKKIDESDKPTRELALEELEAQGEQLEKIRKAIEKEKGVSRIGVEATAISEPGEDERPLVENETGSGDETELDIIIGSKRPSIEDVKIEEERFMTSFADKISQLTKKPKISTKQFNEIASREISLADKVEILLNNFFPGMGEIAILPTGQREGLYKDIKHALADALGAEMLISGEDIGRKIKEIDQRYADDSLRLFEYLKLGKIKTSKDKRGGEQKSIKYAADVNIRLENYPEIK